MEAVRRYPWQSPFPSTRRDINKAGSQNSRRKSIGNNGATHSIQALVLPLVRHIENILETKFIILNKKSLGHVAYYNCHLLDRKSLPWDGAQ